MNLYPEQLAQIQRMIEALNAASDASDTDGADTLPYAFPVIDNEHDELLGYAVDEIGGAFSFAPLGTSMARHAKKVLQGYLDRDTA